MRLLYAFFCLSFFAGAFEYRLIPKQVAEGVYCFFGVPEEITKANGGNMVNTCYVRTNEGYVVIDSGPTFAYASQAYDKMQQVVKLPVKYVINTHDHDDHWLGNSFYKSKGALLIGPQTYAQNVFPKMKTRMERIVGSAIFADTKVVRLDTVVEDTHTVKLGDTLFEIRQLVPQAHTKGDLVVYLPQTKVLFAGDLVFNDRITSLRDGSVIGSLRALELIDALDPDVIVGGHGFKTDANATAALKAYLGRMKEQILEALDNDVPIEEITQKVKLPAFESMKLYDVLHRRNVFDAYRELEMYEDEE